MQLQIVGEFADGAAVDLSLINIDAIDAPNPEVTISYIGLDLSDFVYNGWDCANASATRIICSTPPIPAGGSTSMSFQAVSNGPGQISLSAWPS